MLPAYWGVAQALDIVLPATWQEWALLIFYLILFVAFLVRDRSTLQQFSFRKWIGWLLLGVLALLSSQLFPITLDFNLFPLTPGGGSDYSISLLAAVPSLLAGVFLGPAAALLVGMSAGLGRALGQSHQVLDLFHFAFAAWLAACMLRVKYRGRLYGAMRMPVISGTISQSAIALMAGFSVFVLGVGQSVMGRFDMTLAEVQANIIPLFIEGLFAGVVVTFILLALPSWRAGRELIPAPGHRSVQRYLLTNLLLFGTTVVFIGAVAIFVVTTFITTRLYAAELAAQANAATVQLADAQQEIEDALNSERGNDDLLDGAKVNGRELTRLFRKTPYYDQVLVVDGSSSVTGAYPDQGTSDRLTEKESAAVQESLSEGSISLVLDADQKESPVTLVVPVAGGPDDTKSALIARVKRSSLARALGAVEQDERKISGAIVNLAGEPIVDIGSGDDQWITAIRSQAEPVLVSDGLGGRALLGKSDTGARQLIYLSAANDRQWRVAVSMPYELVLRQSFGFAVPLAVMLVIVAGVFYARLASYSRNLSGSIHEMALTSRNLAKGIAMTPQSSIDRTDELGDLSRALVDMQRDLKKRMDELSLLLSVSRDSAVSFDLAESLPVVLKGALRGTGASGARAVVLNPAGGQLLSFAEGPADSNLSTFDNRLMSLLRENNRLVMGSAQAIRAQLDMSLDSDVGINALYALPLFAEGSFIGFLAVGFRRSRQFSEDDKELLQKLANQASLLTEKSYMFTFAEGGRRRLAAVLASTTESVIVTDPTARILVVNGAMERAFSIEATRVINRSVTDVLDSQPLVDALSTTINGNRVIEVEGKDGRAYLAKISTITNHEGQAIGRVAVLHDVTDLKHLDRLKSEFIDNVSHDLRTPLTVLSGYASALSMLDDLTPEQREYADHIMNSVERMIELVENLLDLGRIEAGVDLIIEETNIGSLLQDIADENWLYAHDSGVRLRVRIAEDLPLIQCDRTLIRQAVSNLLTNGFKYAPNSGDMTLSAELVGPEIHISVRDRGPGIAKADQDRIFEKFYRVKRHGAGSAKGSGLGLSLVRTIAAKHGGQAWCVSEPNTGATFTISLPLEL